MEIPTICRYCGGVVHLVPASKVYGSAAKRLGIEREKFYQCQNCNARVGCHKGTVRPLGIPSSTPLLMLIRVISLLPWDTCAHSYYQNETDLNGGKETVQMQQCSHPVYSSPAYTNQMLLEDWGKGYCRFWTPMPEKGNEHEKQLLHCSAQCHRGRPSLVHRQHSSEKPPSDEGGEAGA